MLKRQLERDTDGNFCLFWGDTILHLCPEQLARLNRLLEEGVFDLFLKEIRANDYCLQQVKPSHFRLWLGRVSLDLALLDFLKLVTLVHQAAWQS